MDIFAYLKGGDDPAAGERTPPERRVLEVGYILDTDKAGFIWDGPRQFRRNDPPAQHAKSAAMCPAVLDYEARLYEVPCPIDAQLRFKMDDNGQPQLINLAGDKSSIRSKHLRQMVAVMARKEWRHPNRPIIQFITPYIFVADDICWMNQMPAFNHYRPVPMPGTMIGGRLPIHIWPRPMMWAFEWWEPSKDLILRRGEPWFYLRFETDDPRRPIRLVEAERTETLTRYMTGLNSVTNYVNRTFSLFQVAEQRRPPRLVQKKAKG